MWLEVCDILHTPTTRWLAYCVLHILARVLGRCSTMELFPSSGSHKHSVHLPDEIYLVKVLFKGSKKAFYCSSLPSIAMVWKSKGLFMHLFFFFEMAHLSCFKIVWINHILTSKHVHANYTTNLNEMDSKQPFWRLTTQNNSFDQSISLGKWVKCMCNPLDRNTQELSTSTNS